MLTLVTLLSALSSCGANVMLRPSRHGHISVDDWPVLCPPRTFYNRQLEKCRPCSACPDNQIITSPCHGVHDTKCGPYYDLHHLIVSARHSGDTFISKNIHHSITANAKTSYKKDATNRKEQDAVKDKPTADDQTDRPTTDLEDTFVDSASGTTIALVSSWKSVTLFACSAFVVVLVVLVVGIYCIRRKIQMLKSTYEYDKAPPGEV